MLHTPWTYTLGNADNPHNGEIRDARGNLLNLRAVANKDDAEIMAIMAAAPDMFEALEAVMMRWNDYLHFANQPGENPEYIAKAVEYGNMARAALAKARGET